MPPNLHEYRRVATKVAIPAVAFSQTIAIPGANPAMCGVSSCSRQPQAVEVYDRLRDKIGKTNDLVNLWPQEMSPGEEWIGVVTI